VLEVNNFLKVHDGATEGYDPYTDHWYLYGYDWYDYDDGTSIKTDWEITEDVNDALFWSPFVESAEVKVTVDNGIARLTGTVDTWSEREAATRSALRAGAATVDNDLTVNYGPDYYNP
jgi:hypothetical protein